MNAHLFSFPLCAVLSVISFSPVGAQDNAPPKSQREHDRQLPQISVIDKLLAIEAALGTHLKPARVNEEQWAKDYEKLYQVFHCDGRMSVLPGAGEDTIVDALALGIKASDAVLALKARNVEALNLAAEQIEQLALKLGASKKELGMADTVKRYANQGRWLDAFLALGFLQRNVLNYLREGKDETKFPKAVLVIVGGWLQGGRCVTDVIAKNYNPDLSNILREPRLVAMIIDEMQALPPDFLGNPMVKKVLDVLPEIKTRVNVGLREPVKEENVKWLHETFDSLVLMMTKPPADGTGAVPAAIPVKP